MTLEGSVSLGEIAASAHSRAGVIWTLEAGSELNANLVRFGTGGGVGEHVNDEVDVIFFGVAGSGVVGDLEGRPSPILLPAPRVACQRRRDLLQVDAHHRSVSLRQRFGDPEEVGRQGQEVSRGLLDAPGRHAHHRSPAVSRVGPPLDVGQPLLRARGRREGCDVDRPLRGTPLSSGRQFFS